MLSQTQEITDAASKASDTLTGTVIGAAFLIVLIVLCVFVYFLGRWMTKHVDQTHVDHRQERGKWMEQSSELMQRQEKSNERVGTAIDNNTRALHKLLGKSNPAVNVMEEG